MITPQIAVCARRMLNPERRERFITLMAAASAMIAKAAEIRREAWALYRDETGRAKR